MKRIISAIAAATLMAAAVPASAGVVGAPTSTNFTLSGPVTVSQSVTLNCVLTLNASIDAAGVVRISGGSLTPNSSLLCPSVTLADTPWVIDGNAPGPQIYLDAFKANTLTGNCDGRLYATWNNATKTVTINTSVPGRSLGSSKDCIISGTLTSSNSSVGLTFTP